MPGWTPNRYLLPSTLLSLCVAGDAIGQYTQERIAESIGLRAMVLADDTSAALDPHADHAHADAMHLLHPLVTESPLPENEARLQFVYDNLPGTDGQSFTLTGTAEFALQRWFSIEVSAPLTHLDPDAGPAETGLDNMVIGAKFASFALEEQGVLLAAGLELGLPTGLEENGIGSDHTYEVEPWVGFAVKRERFEWVGRLGVGLPMNQNGDNEADVELEWATSFLMHIVEDQLAAMIEFDGLSIYGEAEDGFHNISVTPGLRLFPFEDPDISVGIGVRLPLTDDRESEAQGLFTLFFHY